MTLRDRTRNAAYRSLALFAGRRPTHVILMYHSIGGGDRCSVSAEAFEAQMALVAERCITVPVSELRSRREDGRGTASLACITFDDGYRDNYETAVPILERHGIRGTFFIATGFLGGRFRSSIGEHSMLTREHVKTISTLGHEIGAHTVTHPKLTTLAPDAVRREVADSKTFLEDLAGCPLQTFAYPKGAYDDSVKRIVSDVGFKTAVTIREGVLADAPDWLALPRLAIHPGLSLKAFESKLSRASDWYQWLRRSA